MNSLDKYAEDNLISAGGDLLNSRIVEIQRGYTKDKKGIIMDAIQNIEGIGKFEITEGDRIISINYDESINVVSLVMVNTEYGLKDITGVNPVVSYSSDKVMKIEFFYSNWGITAAEACIYIDPREVTQLSIISEGSTVDMKYGKV